MLGKGSYSKKQWQLNREQQRRCKECVAANIEVQPLGVITDTDPTTATQVVVPTIGYLSFPGPETHEQKERRILSYKYLSNSSDILMTFTRKENGNWLIQNYTKNMQVHPVRWVEFTPPTKGVLNIYFDPDWDRNKIEFPIFYQMKDRLTQPRPELVDNVNQCSIHQCIVKLDDDEDEPDILSEIVAALAHDIRGSAMEEVKLKNMGRFDEKFKAICNSLCIDMYTDQKEWADVTGLCVLLLDTAIKKKSCLTRTAFIASKLGETLVRCGLFAQAAVIYAEAGKHLFDYRHPTSSSVNCSAGLAWEEHGDYEMAESNYVVALQSLPFVYNHTKYREGAFHILERLLGIYGQKNFAQPKLAATLRPLLIGVGADLSISGADHDGNSLLPEFQTSSKAMRSAIQYIIINSSSVQSLRESIEKFSGDEERVVKSMRVEKMIVKTFDDEDLFKQPPPNEECQICFLPMPHTSGEAGSTYQSCCGKEVCDGCIWAIFQSDRAQEDEKGEEKETLCAFCRTPMPDSPKEMIRRCTKRAEANDPGAFYSLANYYHNGRHGLVQSDSRGNEKLIRGAELGSSKCQCKLGMMYLGGYHGVEKDEEKAFYYMGLASIGGSTLARKLLGNAEFRKDNIKRALLHWMIAARSGDKESLERVQYGFKNAAVTKDEYANTLRAYQKSHDSMQSKERDEAVASGKF